MRMVRNRLEATANSRFPVRTVWFNAWLYHDDLRGRVHPAAGRDPRPQAGGAAGLLPRRRDGRGQGAAAAAPVVAAGLDAAQVETWRRKLRNYRENLLLIEERMSEYVEFTDIPLQLVRNKRQIEARIAELERRLAG